MADSDIYMQAHDAADANGLVSLPDSENQVKILLTTLPARDNAPTTGLDLDTDDYTECLFLDDAIRDKIVKTPNFPQSVPHVIEKLFRIGSSPGKGLGMFATQDIEMGDFIHAARPLIIVPVKFVKEWHIFQEKLLFLCIKRLSLEGQVAFMNLTHSHIPMNGCDRNHQIKAIISTNGFGMNIFYEPESDSCTYSAVYKDISRINHSCSPNVQIIFDVPSFSCQLRAVRPIKKDTEFTIQYTDIFQSYEERKKALVPYQIECTCMSCSNPKESNQFREELRQAVDVKALRGSWLADTSLPGDLIVEHCSGWIRKLDQWGLQSLERYRYYLWYAYTAAVALGDAELAHKFGTNFARRLLVDLPQDQGVDTIKIYSDRDKCRKEPGWRIRGERTV
ncbi:hypothetical protein BDQ12DRAFT_730270 [Crucibulum laeve]|uniref:SET domain-containing protein n=1 Tax=Crucibulum laeve TaxID=68775 RepID=A0A5C3MFI3_9AGAR|nr:hypothetical protein BDQ12DRAFT_730270 [Crucibulum laeve]